MEETIAVTAVDEILDAVVLDVLVIDGVHHGFAVVAPHPFDKIRTESGFVFRSVFFGVLPPTPPKPPQPLFGLVGGLFDELAIPLPTVGDFVKMQVHFGSVTLNINPQAQARPGFPIHRIVALWAPGLHIRHAGMQRDVGYQAIGGVARVAPEPGFLWNKKRGVVYRDVGHAVFALHRVGQRLGWEGTGQIGSRLLPLNPEGYAVAPGKQREHGQCCCTPSHTKGWACTHVHGHGDSFR